jgi:hypothetical protein
MRLLSLFCLTAMISSLLSGTAHAEPKGIVVRVNTDGHPVSGTSAALLTPAGGETQEIPLFDAGEPPDVTAADGVFSGSAWLEGETFAISVRLGDQVHDAGRVSWDPSDSKRDLSITIMGGMVTAEAGVSNAPAGQGPGATPPVSDELGNPPSAGAGQDGPSPVGPPQAGSAAPEPPVNSRSAMLIQLLGLALGLVVIGAVARWWWRTGPDPQDGPLGLAPLAEPGLLGPGTPSLSDPVSVWAVSPGDLPALVRPLLATVARHRVVCLLTPATLAPPRVHGGPVYPTADLAEFHDALGELSQKGLGRAAGFAVVEQLDAKDLENLVADVPPGVALVVLVSHPANDVADTVACRLDGAQWVFGSGDNAVVTSVTAQGLQPVSP